VDEGAAVQPRAAAGGIGRGVDSAVGVGVGRRRRDLGRVR